MKSLLIMVISLVLLASSACISASWSAQPPAVASPAPKSTPPPLSTMIGASELKTMTPTPSRPSPTATRRATATPSPTSTARPTALSANDVPKLIVQGNNEKPWVAFTFDLGGEAGSTAEVLDILRDNGIHSTFFTTGQWAEANPELLKRIVAEGHKIANHSYSHPDFTTIADAEIASQLTRTEEIIQRISGASTKPYLRPPFGAYDNRVLREIGRLGYTSIYWTIDGTDWRDDSTVDSVVRWVMKNVAPGAIIVHHAAPSKTAKALPQEIRQIRERGLQIVNLPDLLGE